MNGGFCVTSTASHPSSCDCLTYIGHGECWLEPSKHSTELNLFVATISFAICQNLAILGASSVMAYKAYLIQLKDKKRKPTLKSCTLCLIAIVSILRLFFWTMNPFNVYATWPKYPGEILRGIASILLVVTMLIMLGFFVGVISQTSLSMKKTFYRTKIFLIVVLVLVCLISLPVRIYGMFSMNEIGESISFTGTALGYLVCFVISFSGASQILVDVINVNGFRSHQFDKFLKESCYFLFALSFAVLLQTVSLVVFVTFGLKLIDLIITIFLQRIFEFSISVCMLLILNIKLEESQSSFNGSRRGSAIVIPVKEIESTPVD